MDIINWKIVFSVWVLVTVCVSVLLADNGIYNPLRWLAAGTGVTFIIAIVVFAVIGFFMGIDVWTQWVVS